MPSRNSIVGHGCSRDADHRETGRQPPFPRQAIERGHQFAFGQIAIGAEDHDRARRCLAIETKRVLQGRLSRHYEHSSRPPGRLVLDARAGSHFPGNPNLPCLFPRTILATEGTPRTPGPVGARRTSITAVIPARNEADIDRRAPCARSGRKALPAPCRSSWRTIKAKMAPHPPRHAAGADLVVSVDPRPSGWKGKLWAVASGIHGRNARRISSS